MLVYYGCVIYVYRKFEIIFKVNSRSSHYYDVRYSFSILDYLVKPNQRVYKCTYYYVYNNYEYFGTVGE